MFCALCGTLLQLQSGKSTASCPLCNFQRDVSALASHEIVSRSGPTDFMRRFDIDPLIKPGAEAPEAGAKDRERATVDEPCPKCGYFQLEYYTLQLRSADEGQTVFYECSKCRYKFSQNN
eukprot:jgi/Mesvir1/8388/Mv12633-RA.1